MALDATEAMLARGKTQATADGCHNVLFMRGDAAALPFLDGSFDVVVSRFAAHHFERPEAVVAEMVRCTRPGGHVALVDLVADEDPPGGRRAEPAGAPARSLAYPDAGRDRDGRPMLTEAGLEAIDVGHTAAGAAADAMARAGADASRRPRVRSARPWTVRIEGCAEDRLSAAHQ